MKYVTNSPCGPRNPFPFYFFEILKIEEIVASGHNNSDDIYLFLYDFTDLQSY